mgnify:CR=1 FL=1
MKDPKVTKLVKELDDHIKSINKLNVALNKQGVTYRIEDGHDAETGTKIVSIQYLRQTIEY